MLVGVTKEIKIHEYRVGLTPAAVREYVEQGHSVLVEAEAGIGIGASNSDYTAAGAVVLDTAGDIFARASMIVKVKEPQPEEWVQLRPGQILFTYLPPRCRSSPGGRFAPLRLHGDRLRNRF